MSVEVMNRAEELRQQGLAKVRANQVEESLALFDQALAVTDDEELRELISINKAYSLLRMERTGAEVQQLPRIIMRRRSLRNVYQAAYALQRKFVNEKDYGRAAFYAKTAYETAVELQSAGWQANALITMGNLAVVDSRCAEAIDCYERALALMGSSDEERVARAMALQNIGYCRLMIGQTPTGVEQIHAAIDALIHEGAELFTAECYIDLCLGYLDLENLDKARHYGELGLEKATEIRQVRNAHYLLGEVAMKAEDAERAEFHFDHLARYYPDFANLKTLLYALDLRKVVNFKL